MKYRNLKKVYIWKETFVVIKSKKALPRAFANIIDKNEVTVIIEQSKYNKEDIIEIEKDWKILTFDMVLPFDLVGFLAEISRAFAEEGIPIFVISAYSRDHILIKKKDLSKAIRKLRTIGYTVK